MGGNKWVAVKGPGFGVQSRLVALGFGVIVALSNSHLSCRYL